MDLLHADFLGQLFSNQHSTMAQCLGLGEDRMLIREGILLQLQNAVYSNKQQFVSYCIIFYISDSYNSA